MCLNIVRKIARGIQFSHFGKILCGLLHVICDNQVKLTNSLFAIPCFKVTAEILTNVKYTGNDSDI